MAFGTQPITMETKDEDKWFKFFTKGQLLIVGLALAGGVGITKAFYAIGLTVVGVFIAFIVLLVAVIIAMVNMPLNKHQIGGGEKLSILLLRMILHKHKHKYIYLRNYDRKAD